MQNFKSGFLLGTCPRVPSEGSFLGIANCIFESTYVSQLALESLFNTTHFPDLEIETQEI
jgi:hypothetical protein